MPNYKLTYFNVRARAEPSRYLFAIAGTEYEDCRVSSDEWKALKPTIPLGQLPILEVDGKQFGQSHAIHRFVAGELGLYGATPFERFPVDVVIETAMEASPHVARIFSEQDATAKDDLKKKLKEDTLPGILSKLEKLLAQNNGGKGWFVRDKITLADVMVFNMLFDFLPAILGGPIDLSNHALVKGLIGRFEAVPKVSAWIKARPVTNM